MEGALRLALEDPELVRRARAGDRDAFRLLYERHAPPLLAFLERIARDPEEALADVFVRAHARLEACDPERPFGAWLVGIARNVVRERSREELAVAPVERAAPEPEEANDDEMARLLAFVAELPERERDVIRLRFREGRTLVETATELGCSRRTVANLQKSALARLARAVRERRKGAEP